MTQIGWEKKRLKKAIKAITGSNYIKDKHMSHMHIYELSNYYDKLTEVK
jgi:hypothetical protein